jgi:rare lipoprotein A (peptidoglycan hydrolase)
LSLRHLHKPFLCSRADAFSGAFLKGLVTGVLVAFLSFPAICASHQDGGAHTHTIQKVQYGMASWYGAEAQGRLMACGRPFNDQALIAAHRTLPFGTRVKITNLRNGRSVVVKIEDRGPALHNRLIDLSKAAASHLGFVHRGVTPVRVRVVSVPKDPEKSGEAALTSQDLADARFENSLR